MNALTVIGHPGVSLVTLGQLGLDPSSGSDIEPVDYATSREEDPPTVKYGFPIPVSPTDSAQRQLAPVPGAQTNATNRYSNSGFPMRFIHPPTNSILRPYRTQQINKHRMTSTRQTQMLVGRPWPRHHYHPRISHRRHVNMELIYQALQHPGGVVLQTPGGRPFLNGGLGASVLGVRDTAAIFLAVGAALVAAGAAWSAVARR